MMASSSSQSVPEKDLNFHLPLYKAAIRGDWEGARKIFDSNPDAVTARISKISETVLHIAVGRSEAIRFVEKLVELMPTEALSLMSKFRETALHYTAKYGNVEAAKLLVARDPELPHIRNDTNFWPLHLAALFGQKEMVVYLLTVTRENVEPNPFVGRPGSLLLCTIVHSGFYDVALDLVRRHPKLATTITPGGNTALSILAGIPSAFPSGGSLSFWQKLIYSWIPLKLAKASHLRHGCDVENLSEQPAKQMSLCWQSLIQNFRRDYSILVWQKVYTELWNIIGRAVPQVKKIHDTKLIHRQAMELVKCLCMEIVQMQSELQWYKEVEKFVTPSYNGKENSDGKMPSMVFTEEHKDLVVAGEKWLKDTAKSCTFAATLIATVVFAAAITVPGGSSTKTGLPIFEKKSPFVVFVISNALSLCSSMVSVSMFLFILNSRCAEGDFLYSLPNKLIIGLVNLFLSLAFMMIAFTSAIYTVFGRGKAWILVSLTVLTCVPMSLFLSMQFPLVKDMIRSTHGPGIFGKNREYKFRKIKN
ncbi:uncharacterized protein [Henckelia pumila]|uniref:uncharacterized protein isoform X2 n=1 Tax=Henckelia pumila TaxID=405737 RepID=UPI003C6E82F9